MDKSILLLEEIAARGEKVHGMCAHEAVKRLRRAIDIAARIAAENALHPKDRHAQGGDHAQ